MKQGFGLGIILWGVDQYGGNEVLLWVGRVLEGDTLLVDVDIVGDGGLCLLGWLVSCGDIRSSAIIGKFNRLLLFTHSGIIFVCFHLCMSKYKERYCLLLTKVDIVILL